MKQQTANATDMQEMSPPRTSAANYSSQKTSPLRLENNQMQNNTTIGSNGPQHTEDGSPGSPYQVMLSHRRFNSALGQNQMDSDVSQEGRNIQKGMKGGAANARSVATLSKISKPDPAMQADKSSLFAEIVSLRDSTSSRQKGVMPNLGNKTPGGTAPSAHKLRSMPVYS